MRVNGWICKGNGCLHENCHFSNKTHLNSEFAPILKRNLAKTKITANIEASRRVLCFLTSEVRNLLTSTWKFSLDHANAPKTVRLDKLCQNAVLNRTFCQKRTFCRARVSAGERGWARAGAISERGWARVSAGRSKNQVFAKCLHNSKLDGCDTFWTVFLSFWPVSGQIVQKPRLFDEFGS